MLRSLGDRASAASCLLTPNAIALQEFYGNISSTLGVATLFIDVDRYLIEAASSTVATALSTGMPLIVEPGFLDVYVYVSARAVVVAKDRNFADAMESIMQMSQEQWSEMSMEVSCQMDATRSNHPCIAFLHMSCCMPAIPTLPMRLLGFAHVKQEFVHEPW